MPLMNAAHTDTYAATTAEASTTGHCGRQRQMSRAVSGMWLTSRPRIKYCGPAGASTPVTQGGSWTNITPQSKTPKGVKKGGTQPRTRGGRHASHDGRDVLPRNDDQEATRPQSQTATRSNVIGSKCTITNQVCWARTAK